MADLNEDLAYEESFNPIDANTKASTSSKLKHGMKSRCDDMR